MALSTILLIPMFYLNLFFTSATVHQFHVSKSMVEYNEKERAIQVSMHIFLDDLEVGMEKEGMAKTFLCSEKETAEAEAQLQKYVQQKFKITVNGTPHEYEYIGKEASEDLAAVWCYLEIPNLQEVSSLEITNDILMNAFADQKNIVQISKSGKTKGYFMFQKGNSTDKVEF